MYKEFYGFTEKPFENTPDPKFIYLNPSYRNVLNSLMDGIKNRAGFISITGEAGTGKTLLIYSILFRLDERVKTALIYFPSSNLPGLIRNILRELYITDIGENKGTLFEQLNEYLTGLAPDETLAVFVDEAQNLPGSVLKELGNLQEMNPGILNRLQIFFIGQSEFDDKLSSGDLKQFKQKIKTRFKLRTLTDDESRGYIDHRLRVAGSRSSSVFTPDAIAMIVRHAKGIPRVINILCDNAFLFGCSLFRRKIDAEIIREVIKHLEGPALRKTIPGRILNAATEFPLAPFRSSSPREKVSFIILSLICFGGLLLTAYGPLQLRLTNALNAQSPSHPLFNTETPLLPSSPEPNLKIDMEDAPDEQERFSSIPPSLTPQSVSPIMRNGSHIVREVTAVKKGQTLFDLARKSYGMANITLVDLILDFNPEILNAHLVKINQPIKIPEITRELLILQSTGPVYKVHLGTFRISDLAEVYREEPALRGKEIECVLRKASPKENWYKVVAGPFGHKEECLRMIDQLREKGLLPAFGGILKRYDMETNSKTNHQGASS